MKKVFQALSVGLVLVLLCGFAYPLLVLGIGQLIFPGKANGSMVSADGRIVGSELIGQDFKDARFFHGRVSSVGYNTFAAGSNVIAPRSGSTNDAACGSALKERIQKDVAAFLKENPTVSLKDLPADLFTSSASGLDPDISRAAAEVQADRVAKATGLPKEKVEQILGNSTSQRFLGVFGEPTVNVLKANLGIYRLLQKK